MSGLGGLGVLKNTRPVDRLRFQAILVFKHFDKDGDGRLTAQELGEYAAYCEERFKGLPEGSLLAMLDKARVGAKPAPAASPPSPEPATATALEPAASLDMESFIDLVREQVAAASANGRAFLRASFGDAETGRLGWDTSLGPRELAAALAVFRLLDFNGDSYLALADLRKAQGIEREIVDDKLEDADTNDDGFLSFKDFLASYARERPVVLNMIVLAAHSAVFWLVLNLPALDLPVKGVICAALLLKPQWITGPVIKIYTIIRAVYDRARAEVAMAQLRGRGGDASA